MLNLAGITFHLYGLIVGVAIAAGWWAVMRRAARAPVDQAWLERTASMVLVAGVVGARAWHVLTDWSLYANQPWQAFFIWQGGLSIIGAVLGGTLMLWWRCRQRAGSLRLLLDLAMFGLPLGQAIGRLGNFANQELYGLPSQLPWAITIEPAYRVAGYEQVAQYHPLFLYEMLATLGFWLWLQWFDQLPAQAKPAWWRLGTGHYFLSYIVYYGVVRWCLDFLRLPQPPEWALGMGINQWVLILVVVVALGWGMHDVTRRTYEKPVTQ